MHFVKSHKKTSKITGIIKSHRKSPKSQKIAKVTMKSSRFVYYKSLEHWSDILFGVNFVFCEVNEILRYTLFLLYEQLYKNMSLKIDGKLRQIKNKLGLKHCRKMSFWTTMHTLSNNILT